MGTLRRIATAARKAKAKAKSVKGKVKKKSKVQNGGIAISMKSNRPNNSLFRNSKLGISQNISRTKTRSYARNKPVSSKYTLSSGKGNMYSALSEDLKSKITGTMTFPKPVSDTDGDELASRMNQIIQEYLSQPKTYPFAEEILSQFLDGDKGVDLFDSIIEENYGEYSPAFFPKLPENMISMEGLSLEAVGLNNENSKE